MQGSVNKLGVDDKGTTMVAAFGLPPVAHEDDGVRAVRAALGIQAQLRRLEVPYAIGMLPGRRHSAARSGATCGANTPANRWGRDHGARLMQTALDDLVCDRATHQAANAKLTLEPLPPRRVEGRRRAGRRLPSPWPAPHQGTRPIAGRSGPRAPPALPSG